MRSHTTNFQLKSEVNNRYLMVVCSIAAFCQFATGYEIGGVNAVYNQFDMLFTSLFITSLLIGLCLGSLAVKPLSSRYGRRHLMIVSACVLLAGTALVRTSQNIVNSDIPSFVGRFIDGFGCGIGSTVAPIYSQL
jgi:MFS family permease